MTNTHTTAKKAVLFARVSSTNNRQETGKQSQINLLQAYSQTMNYQVQKEFTENISGAKLNNERPALQECLSYCFDNRIDILLVSELSRLGRNSIEVIKTIDEAKTKNLNIYFIKEGFSIFQADGSINPFLTIIVAVMGTVAEMERTNIVHRLNAGRNSYITNGGKLGRNVGYRKSEEQKKLEYSGIIKRLNNGEKIRDIAVLEKVGVSTVQRIKKQFNL